MRDHLFTDFYGILPASPVSPPKIVSWYIKTCHLSRFLQHHSNSFLSHYSTMPMQSRILTPPFASSLDVVPFNPTSNSSVLRAILESSFLTMTLKRHHIHAISKIHNFHSLDFDLTNGIWYVLKDLSRSIHEAADPTINPFEALPSQINPTHLCEIEMVSPRILQIENFSQNMLLCAMTCEEIHRLFTTAQGIGMEALECIAEAKKRCGILGRAHGWHWSVDEKADSDLFSALEGQLSLLDTAIVPSNTNTLILHPHFSTQPLGLVTLPPPE